MWQQKSVITLILISAYNIQYSLTKIEDNGYTIPSGDINLEYNKDIINITCYLTNETMVRERIRIDNPSPSDFVFKIAKEKVPEDQIIRLNATAIRYVNEIPEIMESFFSCQYKNEGVGLNSVIVGTKPNNVTDFDCFGYNLENMTCSWTRDQASKYMVNYTLSYHFGNHALQSNCGEYEETSNVLSCFWNSSKKPLYRPTHDKIHFNLIGRNHLGINNQSFEIDHYRKVRISAPANLRVLDKTISTFNLSWEIPNTMVATHVYLQHRIMYTYENSGFADFKVAKILTTNCKSKVITTSLTDLPFAYTLYDIRVGMRMNRADSEDMWSLNATLTDYSNMARPGAPHANINSFYNSTDAVTIYWKQLERLYQNGQNFVYVVTSKGANNVTTTTNGYLQLFNLNRSQSYIFEIRSRNSEGESYNFTTIIIPRLDKPKIRMDFPILKEFSNTLYQLSWGPPIEGAKYVRSYTVYWCESSKVSSSHLCSNINWITLPTNVTSHNITISNNNNIAMAISANGSDESTSMVWAECIVRHDKPLQKITNFFDKANATSITIKWTVKCIDKTKTIENYYIEYCKTNSTNSYCEGEKRNQSITTTGGYDEEAVITNLEPYTTYRIQILMKDVGGSFSSSDERFVTTLEGTPDAPNDLKITNESNSSISLEWDMPQKGNSKVIRYFEIKYNNMTTIVNRTITIQNYPEKQNYTLIGLHGYERYNISIRACIGDRCSKYTPAVSGKTRIGRPSKIDKVHFNSLNNSITWGRPAVPGGKVDYYEIEVTFDGGDDPERHKLDSPVYALETCGENSRYSTVAYQVRAVNVLEGNQIYAGPWSNRDKQKCQKPGDYRVIIYVTMSVFLFGVLLVLILLFGKRCYIYFITMKDVQFQLPEGLYDNKDRFPRGNEIDYIKEPPGDDQFLLCDKDGTKRSRDSSGCSSGQDSAESDSGTSLSSSTDSGTEQPRTKDDDLVEAVALDDFNSSNSGNGGSYCQLGYSESKEVTPFSFPKDIPYIRSNESTSSSDISPYIRCEQVPSPVENESRPPANSGYVASSALMQMPPSGYVPHPVEEKKSSYVPHSSTDKNSGYVMAADKNSVMPNAENKGYVQVADANNASMPNNEGPPRSNGYVSYGDVKSLPASPEMKSSSSYVSHKQLDEVLNKH